MFSALQFYKNVVQLIVDKDEMQRFFISSNQFDQLVRTTKAAICPEINEVSTGERIILRDKDSSRQTDAIVMLIKKDSSFVRQGLMLAIVVEVRDV